MGNTLYAKEFASTMGDVGDVLRDAVDALVEHKWLSEEHAFGVRLCIEEALVNAVRHGNKNDSGRMVRIRVFEEGERCHIRVQDEGDGFDPQAINMPDCESLGGRGVCLIKHFMEDVRFDGSENALEMTFDRKTFACGCT